MAFVFSFESAVRRVRTAVRGVEPIHVLPPRVRKVVEAGRNFSKLRLQVLWRDRYRCRSCNCEGDEITLEIHCIQPSASSAEEMVVLCAHCGERAAQWDIKAGSDTEFLEMLWRRMCLAADPNPWRFKELNGVLKVIVRYRH